MRIVSKFGHVLILSANIDCVSPCAVSDGYEGIFRKDHQNFRGGTSPVLNLKSQYQERLLEIVSRKIKRIGHRSLQEKGCFSAERYDILMSDVAELGNSIPNFIDRGHFFGGIVRLAAHDFMDYHQAPKPGEESGGSDGCIDFDDNENVGLGDIWCDECPLKLLRDGAYRDISVADYWVAIANAAVMATSVNGSLVMPFRWGRVDSNVCPNSSARLPKSTGCSEVQGVFIDRMGLTWKDAVALIGAHTLGRGGASGHVGTWASTPRKSSVFNKDFFVDLKEKHLRPRRMGEVQDWTWGDTTRNTLFLNTDVCLYFDIPEDRDPTCCTNTGRNCQGVFQNNHCPSANSIRRETVAAVDLFTLGGPDDHTRFYDGFSLAWGLATENGQGSNLRDLCVLSTLPVTPSPTPNPTLNPAPASTSTVAAPSCEDVAVFLDSRGRERDCNWINSRTRMRGELCASFGQEFCPVTCDICNA